MTVNPGRRLNNFKNFDNSPLNNLKWEDMKKWKKQYPHKGIVGDLSDSDAIDCSDIDEYL